MTQAYVGENDNEDDTGNAFYSDQDRTRHPSRRLQMDLSDMDLVERTKLEPRWEIPRAPDLEAQ